MKIEIPKSLFEFFEDQLENRAQRFGKKYEKGKTTLQFNGLYGVYEIVPKEDKDYTEEVPGMIRRYKGDDL